MPCAAFGSAVTQSVVARKDEPVGRIRLQGHRHQLVVAIDGPAGAGKSTVARKVAARLGYVYVDSGAMYRAITLNVLQKGIGTEDEANVAAVASRTSIDLVAGREGNESRVFIDGCDVTDKLRSPEVSESVATVAANPAVRGHLIEAQRRLAAKGGVVMDGRDIGTVVLPDADVKVYLTASLAERARRRCQELLATGYEVDPQEVAREIALRDSVDSNRDVSPLSRAPDAVLIDTTHMPIELAVEEVIGICREIAGAS